MEQELKVLRKKVHDLETLVLELKNGFDEKIHNALRQFFEYRAAHVIKKSLQYEQVACEEYFSNKNSFQRQDKKLGRCDEEPESSAAVAYQNQRNNSINTSGQTRRTNRKRKLTVKGQQMQNSRITRSQAERDSTDEGEQNSNDSNYGCSDDNIADNVAIKYENEEGGQDQYQQNQLQNNSFYDDDSNDGDFNLKLPEKKKKPNIQPFYQSEGLEFTFETTQKGKPKIICDGYGYNCHQPKLNLWRCHKRWCKARGKRDLEKSLFHPSITSHICARRKPIPILNVNTVTEVPNLNMGTEETIPNLGTEETNPNLGTEETNTNQT